MKCRKFFISASLLFTVPFAINSVKAQSVGDLLKKASHKGKTEGEKLHLPPYFGPKKRLAVLSLDIKVTDTNSTVPSNGGSSNTIQIPPPSDFGTGLTEMLTTALMDSKRFIVLERSDLQDIQTEQQLDAGGTVNPNTVPKPGQLLGAQEMIHGAVTEYLYSESSLGGGGVLGKLGVSGASSTAMVGMDIRIVDETTGQILYSVHAVGKASSNGTSLNYTQGDTSVNMGSVKNTPLGEACRKAIAQAVLFICKKMDAIPWEARVADVEPGDNNGDPTIYINSGKDAGIAVGEQLELFKPGHTIIDPDTQTVIGHTLSNEEGMGHVTAVRDHIAVVSIDSGTGFAVGDIVRLPLVPPVDSGSKTTNSGGGSN